MRSVFNARLLVAVAAALLAAGCAPASPTQPPQPTAPAALPITWIWTAVSGVSGGAWTAVDAAYFKEEGLNVELRVQGAAEPGNRRT